MEPWSIRTEQKFLRSRAFYGLDNVVVLANRGCVREHVRVAGQLVHDLLVGAKIIGVAAEMGQQ
jgi:hypothetical protein